MAHLSLGAVPRSVWVTLEDDLVDLVKPGDDVEVIGVVTRRWKPLGKAAEDKTDVSLCIKAMNITVSNSNVISSAVLTEEAEREFRAFWSQARHRDVLGRAQLVSLFCPQVYGLYLVKLALMVALAGGVDKVLTRHCDYDNNNYNYNIPGGLFQHAGAGRGAPAAGGRPRDREESAAEVRGQAAAPVRAHHRGGHHQVRARSLVPLLSVIPVRASPWPPAARAAPGTWRPGRWSSLTAASAASTSSGASGRRTAPASTRPWSSRWR